MFDPANPVAGVPTTIPNPSVLIGHIFECHLKMLRYYIYHFNTRIQRAFYAPAATLVRLNTLYAFKQQEEEHDNESLYPTSSPMWITFELVWKISMITYREKEASLESL